jgi:hypothetical protein
MTQKAELRFRLFFGTARYKLDTAVRRQAMPQTVASAHGTEASSFDARMTNALPCRERVMYNRCDFH